MLYQTLAFIIHGKIYKFKTLAPTWNEEFELPDESYSVSDIQDYFKCILKKHEAVTDISSIMIYVNKIENRVMFKIETGYYFELLMPETMKFLGITKSKTNKDKNGENVPHLGITEVVLIHCNIVNNNYQQDSKVLYTFVPNKSFGQLLDISLKNFICKVHNIKNDAMDGIFVKGYGFLSFAKNMGKNIDKNISKSLSGKYSQKLLDHAKQSATDALKTASKRAIQKNSKSKW